MRARQARLAAAFLLLLDDPLAAQQGPDSGTQTGQPIRIQTAERGRTEGHRRSPAP